MNNKRKMKKKKNKKKFIPVDPLAMTCSIIVVTQKLVTNLAKYKLSKKRTFTLQSSVSSQFTLAWN
jgi:hypothetical protein